MIRIAAEQKSTLHELRANHTGRHIGATVHIDAFPERGVSTIVEHSKKDIAATRNSTRVGRCVVTHLPNNNVTTGARPVEHFTDTIAARFVPFWRNVAKLVPIIHGYSAI